MRLTGEAMAKKKYTKKEQAFWHQKLINMIPSDVTIGELWATRLFDEKYYSVRTLKAFCFAFAWLKENRQLLPNGQIRFHGKYFMIRNNSGELLAEVDFSGCKFDHILLFNEMPNLIEITNANPVPSSWSKTI